MNNGTTSAASAQQEFGSDQALAAAWDFYDAVQRQERAERSDAPHAIVPGAIMVRQRGADGVIKRVLLALAERFAGREGSEAALDIYLDRMRPFAENAAI